MPDQRDSHLLPARDGALGGSRKEGAAAALEATAASGTTGRGARGKTGCAVDADHGKDPPLGSCRAPRLTGKTQALTSSSQGHGQRSVQLREQNGEFIRQLRRSADVYGVGRTPDHHSGEDGRRKDEHADVVPADEPRERCQERGTVDRHLAAQDDDEESHLNKTMLNKALSGKRCRRRHRRYCYRRGIWSGDRVGAFGRLLLAVPLASMWRTLGVEAVFAPRNRAELQGDGGAELGVFGCVGACGEGLKDAGISYWYCSSSANGPWESGNGTCVNADENVPDGQGTGKYGAIGTWDVSKVTDMSYSEPPHLSSPLPPSLSAVCVCAPRAPLSLSFCLLSHLSSLHPQCFIMRISSAETSRHGMSPK